MNLPNKLTMLRMAMIPVFVIFMMVPLAAGRYIALAVFIAASLTDTADGYIARKYNLVQISESLWIRLQTSCWFALR